MATSTKTPKHRLADVLLGRPLASFVGECRARGLSWEGTARAIYDATDRSLTIAGETLRAWFPEHTDNGGRK